jgi:hypothetical protein
MKDADQKTPHPQDPVVLPLAWLLFYATIPEAWIPGLIAIVIIKVFGVPDEFRLAVFIFALIVVLMVGSAVAVYLFGRSLKHRK